MGNCVLTCDCKQSKCCVVDAPNSICEVCFSRQSFSDGRFVKCSSCGTTEEADASLLTGAWEYDTIDIDELQRNQDRWNGFCGISACDQDSYCVVHSFTRLGIGKAELCFEAVRSPRDAPQKDPSTSSLSWDEGSLFPTLRRCTCDENHVITGVLLYEGIPDELLSAGKQLQFRYASADHSPLCLAANPRH